MAVAPGEKVLAGELLVSFVTVWVAAVVKSRNVPAPRQVLGVGFAYAALALVAAVGGQQVAKVAAGVGGLVALTIVMNALGTATAGPGGSVIGSVAKAAETVSTVGAVG